MSSYGNIRKSRSMAEWLRYHFLEQKTNSAFVISIICIFAVAVGYAGAAIDFRSGLGLLGLFMVIFLVIIYLRYPVFGLYALIAYSAFPSLLGRIFMDSSIKIEFSNLEDILTILLFFSVITNSRSEKKEGQKFWGNPISISFLILCFFYILEALNPNMHSILGWVSYFRKYIVLLLSLYILFNLLDSWKAVKFFIGFNIALTTLLAIYSCKQQWFGLAAFEMRWATASPAGYALLLQGGLLRKWFTLSDPATSGILFFFSRYAMPGIAAPP